MSRHYLIGHGEQISEPITPVRGGAPKSDIYTFEESCERLQPELHRAIQLLPTERAFSPNDVQVMQFILHPSYLAKSSHPSSFIRSTGLTLLGSKPLRITTADRPNEPPRISSSLLIAGKRRSFEKLDQELQNAVRTPGTEHESLTEIIRFESIKSYTIEDKIHQAEPNGDWYELVLHSIDRDTAPDNISAFIDLTRQLNIEIEDKLNFQYNDLLYLPVHGKERDIRTLANYTTIRAIRPMPRLKLEPIAHPGIRSTASPTQIPEPKIMKGTPRVAILDGGLPQNNPLGAWNIDNIKMDPSAADVSEYTQHGLAVCSALIFGNLGTSQTALHSPVTMIRVLDGKTKYDDPLTLYKALVNIDTALSNSQFEYVNLSLGPEIPIEDDDVNAWTATLDNIASKQNLLISVAVGNNGEYDSLSGNNRIEPPGDSVNALCVGSADSEDDDWNRAPYSAVGPGRSPGIVKPDVLAFGGSETNKFKILAPGNVPITNEVMGTSFAAPNALRQAVRIREICGPEITPLAAKTLLIHAAKATINGKRAGEGYPPMQAILSRHPMEMPSLYIKEELNLQNM